MSGTSGVVSDGEGKPEGLTISEAMRRSKKTGEFFYIWKPLTDHCRQFTSNTTLTHYSRPSSNFWIRWDPYWNYNLSAEDLIADDWFVDA